VTRSLSAFAAFALLACPLAARPLAAAADEPPTDTPDTAALFGQLDTNKDAVLSTDEIPEDRKSLFERLLRIGDKNDDGKLDSDEFAAALSDGRKTSDTTTEGPKPEKPEKPKKAKADKTPDAARLFDRLDANGDGKVELDEVPQKRRDMFQKLLARVDKDGDGAVTREEFAKAGPPDAAPGKPAKPGQPPESGRGPAELFKRMDRNADGKVTADEVPEERRPLVAKMIDLGDKDNDSALSMEEFVRVIADRPQFAAAEVAKRKKAAAIAASTGSMPPGLFGVIDANHDGNLDSSEIAASADAIRKLDKDGDGTVSAREIFKAERKKDK
jgi:Ca2+-binding EF-hand superfamily protein